jgi:hypothetical protein
LCGRESFCADEDLPGLDACRDELFRPDPGVVGELAVDLDLVVCVHDQQDADAPVFGSVERPAKRRKPLFASAFMKAACSFTAGCS